MSHQGSGMPRISPQMSASGNTAAQQTRPVRSTQALAIGSRQAPTIKNAIMMCPKASQPVP